MVDFKSSRLESGKEVPQRLFVLLSDDEKAVRLMWHPSASTNMGQEPFLQLSEGIDTSWFQTSIPSLGRSLQGGKKGDTKKGIDGTMNPHAGLVYLQVVQRVGSAVVQLH